MKAWIELNNNIDFRRVLTEINAEVDPKNRKAINGVQVWCKVTKTDFENGVVPNDILAEVNHDKGRTWDRYNSVPCAKFPSRMYVALERTSKSKLDPRRHTGYRHYADPVPDWLFWKWVDHFGIDNVFIDLPEAE